MSGSPSGPPWWGARWVRISSGIIAAGLLLYLALVPTSLFYLSIGSLDCLGPRCSTATTLAVAGGALALVGGLTTVVVLIVFVVRPRRWGLLGSLCGLVLVALAFPMQVWANLTLSDGRALTSEAMQLAFDVDSVTQDAVVSATGLSIWQGGDVWGPDISVSPCEGNDQGFVATARLHFGPGAGVDENARREIELALEQSSARQMLIPESIELSPSWAQDGQEQSLTVTSSCQPLPPGE